MQEIQREMIEMFISVRYNDNDEIADLNIKKALPCAGELFSSTIVGGDVGNRTRSGEMTKSPTGPPRTPITNGKSDRIKQI